MSSFDPERTTLWGQERLKTMTATYWVGVSFSLTWFAQSDVNKSTGSNFEAAKQLALCSKCVCHALLQLLHWAITASQPTVSPKEKHRRPILYGPKIDLRCFDVGWCCVDLTPRCSRTGRSVGIGKRATNHQFLLPVHVQLGREAGHCFYTSLILLYEMHTHTILSPGQVLMRAMLL